MAVSSWPELAHSLAYCVVSQPVDIRPIGVTRGVAVLLFNHFRNSGKNALLPAYRWLFNERSLDTDLNTFD